MTQNMSSKSKKIILKQNNLIECDFKDLEKFTEIHHDLFNELISIFQNDFVAKRNEDINLFNFNISEKTLYVKRATLEKNMKIKRRTTFEIFSLLKDIRDTSVVLKNFINEDGIKSKYRTLQFINCVEAFGDNGKEAYFKIEYTKEFALLCHKNYSLKFGNFTTINLAEISDLKSKYSKALKELFDSRYNLNKSFSINYETFLIIFKYKDKVPFSYITRQLNRVESEMKKHYIYKFEANKKDRVVSFKLIEKLF